MIKLKEKYGTDMKIGNTELRHALMLAPMAGFSDHAMRRVCKDNGAEYSVTEMVSAKAVVYGDKKTAALARIAKDEGAVGLQIFGSEPSVMAEAAGVLSSPIEGGVAPIAIDINMGCPVPKIYGNGEGSALMKNPSLIYDIVRAVKCATILPVSVKMRLGVDAAHINATECALAAEEAGAAFIALHGRTRVQMYAGKADVSEIAKVKECLHIPLIANGDVASAADALYTLRESGADGLMIGRGAIGNPFVFAEIAAALDGVVYAEPNTAQRADTALLQLRLAIEEKGEGVAVREARKQIALYFRSFRGAAELRRRINTATTYSEVAEAFVMAID